MPRSATPPARAPSLSGVTGWQQSGWRSLRQLRGRVVLVWFFSLGHEPSLQMIPGLADLYRRHRAEGLEIIGVHSPDYAEHADPLVLARAAARKGIIWPLAMDHRRTVFRRWQEASGRIGWPRTYVVERDGRIVADHAGDDVTAVAASVEAALAAGRYPS